MDGSDSHYVHGTGPEEQHRLSRLNELMNAASLEAMSLRRGDKVLDVGAGLGQLTRSMTLAVGRRGRVVGVERDPGQVAEAMRRAGDDGQRQLLELRVGDAVDLPLLDDEWGTFDVAHARFLLEHVTDPAAVARSMVRAVRPGGRLILEDDDHEVLRLFPEAPAFLKLWRAYTLTYLRRGKDPYVGRRLVALLHGAGAEPTANRCLFFGTCRGNPSFETMIDNFARVVEGAGKEMLELGLTIDRAVDEGLESLAEWRELPGAALWYTTCWAEGRRPAASR